MPDGQQAITSMVKNPPGVFASFHSFPEIDDAPWDAGILIIDLAARIVAEESTYSQPQHRGEVLYHNGVHGTEVWVLYAVSDDWKFLHSIAEYKSLRSVRARERASRTLLDVRNVLYGRALLEFIAEIIRESVIVAKLA
jgi:hypothetical protein